MLAGVCLTLTLKLAAFEMIMDVWTRLFVILRTKLNSATDLMQVDLGMFAYNAAEERTVTES